MEPINNAYSRDLVTSHGPDSPNTTTFEFWRNTDKCGKFGELGWQRLLDNFHCINTSLQKQFYIYHLNKLI